MKMVAKSVLGSLLMATGINLLMIGEFAEIAKEDGIFMTIQVLCATELLFAVVILLVWFGFVFLVLAIEGWCK